MNPATQTVPGDYRQPRRTEQVILFTVGEHLFAIAADSIAEIRSTDSLAGAAMELTNSTVPKVRHTAQRGRSSYFVVRARLQFWLMRSSAWLRFRNCLRFRKRFAAKSDNGTADSRSSMTESCRW